MGRRTAGRGPRSTLLEVTGAGPADELMSAYDQARWDELQAWWAEAAERRERLPRARATLGAVSQGARGAASRVSRAAAEGAPQRVHDFVGSAVDAASGPTVRGVVHLLDLLNDWVVELTDPGAVLRHHQNLGREVASLEDVRALNLEDVEDFTRGMVLRWRTLGAGQGAGFGALAMIPVPVVGSLAAVTLDIVAMQVLSGAIATRVCYAYGFDASDPELRFMIDRMVLRAYRGQAPKAVAMKDAGSAFAASRGRVNWSRKLREDHRLMAAVEKLLKQLGDGRRVPVRSARMGMPVVAVFAGAGTNSYVLGDIARQARQYAATVFLAQKYGLALPPNLRNDIDADPSHGETGP